MTKINGTFNSTCIFKKSKERVRKKKEAGKKERKVKKYVRQNKNLQLQKILFCN